MLQLDEVEKVLPILHERLAEVELRDTINQKVCCFYCGNGFYEPDELCQICADHLRTGCIPVGVQDGVMASVKKERKPMPNRIGKCFRVSNDFIREHWSDNADAIVSDQGMYIDEREAARIGALVLLERPIVRLASAAK